MSTAGVFAIVLDKRVRFSQSMNSSAQPQFCGSQLFHLLRSLNHDQLTSLKQKVRAIIPVPFDMEIQHRLALGLEAEAGIVESVREEWQVKYPETFWDVGPDALLMILYDALSHNPNQAKFGGDGLFCEWGWVLDLDRYCFDVYRGFVTNAVKNGLDHGIFAEFKGIYDRECYFDRLDPKTKQVAFSVKFHYVPIVRILSFSLAQMADLNLISFRTRIEAAYEVISKKHEAAVNRRFREVLSGRTHKHVAIPRTGIS